MSEGRDCEACCHHIADCRCGVRRPMSEVMRPCPFCGEREVTAVLTRFAYVGCRCGARGPESVTKSEAIRAWNRQAVPGE